MKDCFNKEFIPAWWLRGPHLQTIWPTLFRCSDSFKVTLERIELPDGDFVDSVWEGKIPEATLNAPLQKPLVLVLHGLAGSVDSSYAKPLMKCLSQAGFTSLLMHFRGASGTPNRLPRGYHSGDTQDLAYFVNLLKVRYPGTPIVAIGFSLGANVLLKWLGETGSSNPLSAAIAVSVPFQLDVVANKLMKGFGKVYQWSLLSHLKKEVKVKFQKMPCPFELSRVDQTVNFWEFDDLVTAPLNGFANVHEYYRIASCRQYLPLITQPTLIIHAMDDPFMEPYVIPEVRELSSSTSMEITQHGGHVGFIEGNVPFVANYWLERRILKYLSKIFGKESFV